METVGTMSIEMLELSFLSQRVYLVLANQKSRVADLACQQKCQSERLLKMIVTEV